LVVSLVELLVPELVPEPLVVPEPVPEPEPLTEPEPVPEPVPLVVPERVDDDDPSEQPYNPRPRLTDKTAAVNRYLLLFIDPPFLPPTVTLAVLQSNQYAISVRMQYKSFRVVGSADHLRLRESRRVIQTMKEGISCGKFWP
jgi:hypothetical protein